jgi:hypothetical protein
MEKIQWIFVKRIEGEYEGTKYDNITLSNGLQAATFQNKSGKTFAEMVEGQQVDPTFEVVIKTVAKVPTPSAVIIDME